MSVSCKSANIDLTDDIPDLFDSFLETTNNEACNISSLESKIPKDSSTLSVLDTLKSIQKENPQIETIFLDSDEDEEKLVKKYTLFNNHDVQTISSTSKTTLSPRAIKTTSSPSGIKTVTSPRPKLQTVLLPSRPPLAGQDSSLRVREIAPSMLTTNIVNNSNAIALQDESDKTSKRYLFIPNEILPLLASSRGPISLHVPGIGPLIIPKPSQVGQILNLQSPGKPSVLPPPNALPKPKPPVVPVYDPLNDPKFDCWRYRKGVKRDLDGFCLSDRLGFYQAEQRRSKSCVSKCNATIKKLETSMMILQRKLDLIQGHKFKMENVKLVEIDKIKKVHRKYSSPKEKRSNLVKANINSKSLSKFKMENVKLVEIDKIKKVPKKFTSTIEERSKLVKANVKSKNLSTLQRKNLKTLMSWREHFKGPKRRKASSDSDSNGDDNDLLVTKKVVLLNKNRETKRGRKRKQAGLDLTKKKKIDHTRQVYTNHDEDVLPDIKEKSVKKQLSGEKVTNSLPGRGTPGKNEPINEKNNKKLRGRPKKLKNLRGKKNISNLGKESAVKSCYVEVPSVEMSDETVESYHSYYNNDPRYQRLIDNLEKFKKEIDPSMPLLVVDEIQCAELNITKLSSTNNIVFPTLGSSNLSTDFVTSQKAKNIKFVLTDILCKYLTSKFIENTIF